MWDSNPRGNVFSHPRVTPTAFAFMAYIGRLRPLGQSDIRLFRGSIRESGCSLNLSWNNKNEGSIPRFRLVGRFEY